MFLAKVCVPYTWRLNPTHLSGMLDRFADLVINGYLVGKVVALSLCALLVQGFNS